MRNLLASWVFTGLLFSLVLEPSLAQTPAVDQALRKGPVAERIPRDVSVHGDTRIDEYFWLRNKDEPKVQAHLKAERDHAEAWFAPLAPLGERLFNEMVSRIPQTDRAVPVREGRWWYGQRWVEGKQYPILTRSAALGQDRRFDPAAKEQVLLDMNRLAEGRKFLALGGMVPSPNARLLAWSLDETGARDFLLHIRDMQTGKDLPWTMKGVSSFAWSADSRHLFYVRHNESMRSNTLWRHDLGRNRPDTLLYEEPDTLFNLQVDTSDDGRYVVLVAGAKDTTEQRWLDARNPLGSWTTVMARRNGVEYYAEPQADSIILRINDRGPNFRLVRVPLGKGAVDPAGLADAQELMPHRLDASIDGIKTFRRHLVAQVREGGSVRLQVRRHEGGPWRELAFPEPSYVARALPMWGGRGLNLEYDSSTVRLTYSSMVTPLSTYEATLDGQSMKLLKRQEVLGGYDPAKLESRRLLARAADGTAVPVSLVYSKDLRGTGPRPLLLQGYGSYGIPFDPEFDRSKLSLIERGAIVAIAHIRGGGDLGRHWYRQGKLESKVNTFTDFIAVAEELIKQGYTSPDRLIITGGSAGGLLMGAVTNMRPDLFKAVIAEVPFVDVINTMLDETLPLTTEEFIEWGNPKIPEQYRWMRAYSPYDNLKAVAYPAMLLRTAIHDSQVPYWEAAKYAARMRHLKTDDRPVILDINMDAGHGGASGRFDALRERARVHAFMFQQWGITP